MEKMGKITASNFQIQKLKVLVPEGKWQLLDNSLVFEKDIYGIVKNYQDRMEKMEPDILYKEVIKLVHDVLGWNSLFF